MQSCISLLAEFNPASLTNHWPIILLAVIGLALVFTSVRYIPNDRIGVVEKLWSFNGSVKQGFIALSGEAGYQADVLRGGLHFFFPFQYRVHKVPLVTVAQGKVGYVFARDGQALRAEQTLAQNRPDESFVDVRSFLLNGGQKGPQRRILREGTHPFNLAQFVVLTDRAVYALNLDSGESKLFQEMAALIAQRDGFRPVIIKDQDDAIGIVTVHDGPALTAEEIIAPTVGNDTAYPDTFHNNFQDPEKFLTAGGRRGRQYQVLVEGSYFINRLFATVELIPKTIIEVGNVGVVVSYVGNHGEDRSGAEYRHGELVDRGMMGVWREPLLPGKYAFNTYAGHILVVPTTNFILKWAKDVTGAHQLDSNLAEVSLITRDAFEPLLPLSVVVHIDYKKAPLVVQRFGDIRKLVEQTLDPMVSAYFKNIAQKRTLIELLQERADIQRQASEDMRGRFLAYSLELQEVLIGTPRASSKDPGSHIEQILSQLRQRQVAVEQVETYKLQQRAADQERTLREAEARAKQQTHITESLLSIDIKGNEGKAALARAQQEAEQTKILAAARSEQLRLEGSGQAQQIEMVGSAQAKATELQVAAYGGPQFQLTQQVMNRVAEAIEKGKLDLVPKIIVVSGGAGQGGGSAMDTGILGVLLTMLLGEKIGLNPPTAQQDRNAA